MADKRWKDDPDIGEYTSLADNDYLAMMDTSDGGNEKRVSIIQMARRVLGARTFGGSGNIVTADNSAQTLENKTLNTPKLNDATPVTITGTLLNKLFGWTGVAADINKLTGLATTSTQLGYVAGVSSPIQTQINALAAAIGSGTVESRLFSYYTTVTVGVSSGATITEAEMRTAAGIGSNYRVYHPSIIVQVYKLSGAVWEALSPDGDPNGKIYASTTTAPNGATVLSQINVKAENGAQLNIAVTFRVINTSSGV